MNINSNNVISKPTYEVVNIKIINDIDHTYEAPKVTFEKNSFDYKFYNLGQGRYAMQSKTGEDIDEITGVENLQFGDQSFNLAEDVKDTFDQVTGKDEVSGVVFRMYNAAFGRFPDSDGLKNWINANIEGTRTYAQSAQEFSESQEFKNLYGDNVSDAEFITVMYNNVLEREPDPSGLAHYQGFLAGSKARGAMLYDLSESPEHRELFTDVTGLS